MMIVVARLKSIWISLALLAMAACVPVESLPPEALYSLNTSVTPDGVQKFAFIARKEQPTYGLKQDPHEAHMAALAHYLAREQFCMNGYSVNPSPEDVVGFLYYTGQCK